MTTDQHQKASLENIVIVQEWEESERGWGTRPDGATLHLTDSDRKLYIENYWKQMPKQVPDEYSRPCLFAEPYRAIIDNDLYKEIKTSKNGILLYKGKFDTYHQEGRIIGLR